MDLTKSPYGDDYFDKYVEYAKTDLGKKLTDQRRKLVDRFFTGDVVDVGVGSGAFVAARPNTYGYDVNPKAIRWLRERNCWAVPNDVEAVSCWDTLEHIPDPAILLEAVDKWVFCSLPIFWSVDHVMRSKHFRKDEHFWYWTEKGFRNWMEAQGFELIHHCEIETLLGREDIHSFVFKRV